MTNMAYETKDNGTYLLITYIMNLLKKVTKYELSLEIPGHQNWAVGY